VDWREEALAGRDDLRPVAPEALHVTLVFLGYRPEKEIPAIAEAAFGALRGLPSATLAARAVVPLPKRGPRLFALDLEDEDGRCTAVAGAASAALESARFYEPERRPFWPHLTIARVKRGARAAPLEVEPPGGAFGAGLITLYRSHLSPRGATYEALEQLRLR
jgi:2'-5' RNA ligase